MDGTLVRVNSFRYITKALVVHLALKLQVASLFRLMRAWIRRRTGRLAHLDFKRLVVHEFETMLNEPQKCQIVARVVARYANPGLLEKLRHAVNPVICTAAPFAFASRMPFVQGVPLISALDPSRPADDPENAGPAKLVNLRAYLGTPAVEIATVYTDSHEDDPLILVAREAFMVRGPELQQIKGLSAHV